MLVQPHHCHPNEGIWCHFAVDHSGMCATGCELLFANPLRTKRKSCCPSAVDGPHQGFLASSLTICTPMKESGVTLAGGSLERVSSVFETTSLQSVGAFTLTGWGWLIEEAFAGVWCIATPHLHHTWGICWYFGQRPAGSWLFCSRLALCENLPTILG